MYTAYLDDGLMYDPRVEELNIFNKKIDLEINNPGLFNFKIYPNHPLYNRIKKLDSIIEVYQNNYQVFRGRILDDDIDFYNGKKVLCEGELGYFNDTIIRPFQFQGSQTEFLEWIIDQHNNQVEDKKKFVLGNVTVETSTNYVNRSSVEALKSWEVINTRLIDLLGGFIMVRRQNGVNYIDYLEDSPYRSLQEIKLGENLLDINRKNKGSDIATAIIPYGARLEDEEGNETDERLTVESVNNGSDMIVNQEAADRYGLIVTTKTWDDVTIASNLRARALEELGILQNLHVAIEVKAIDLSMTNDEFDELRFFEYVKVNSPGHSLDDFMLISRLQLDMDNPANNTLTLGLSYDTFTQKQIETDKAVKETNTNIEDLRNSVRESTKVIEETQTNLNSTIEQEADSIRAEVLREYLSKSAHDTYKESVSTEYQQLAESFEFTFTEMSETITTLDDETKAEFEELVKYIRFVEGNIILGQVGNEITLRLMHDRIQFLQNGVEVAYFAHNKMYITDLEVLNSLILGNFSFVPRANGSLDLR